VALQTRISDERFRRILDAIDAISGASDLESYGRIATSALLGLIPSLSASYNELNHLARRAFAVITPDPGPSWFARYQAVFEAHMLDNPLVQLGIEKADTRALTWQDVPVERSILGTALDRLFYEPNGIRSQLVVFLPSPPGVMLGFALNRGSRGFTEEDRETLALLRPHLVHAYRSVQLRSEGQSLRSVLEVQGWAVVLVGDDGLVLQTSPGTAEELRPYGVDLNPGTDLGRGPLRPLLEHIAAYDRRSPSVPSRPLRLRHEDRVIEASVVPGTVAPHVVLLRRSDATQARLALAQRGLSPRQVDVALALVAGGSNRDIAESLGIAVGTVKKHLDALYQQLGVEHRAAAIARLHEWGELRAISPG
jgi:DNA-binding CsgD family transcriptional regulator